MCPRSGPARGRSSGLPAVDADRSPGLARRHEAHPGAAPVDRPAAVGPARLRGPVAADGRDLDRGLAGGRLDRRRRPGRQTRPGRVATRNGCATPRCPTCAGLRIGRVKTRGATWRKPSCSSRSPSGSPTTRTANGWSAVGCSPCGSTSVGCARSRIGPWVRRSRYPGGGSRSDRPPRVRSRRR